MGQIAPGFVADLVLADPAVLTHPDRLHSLLPDAVLVGGQLSATNYLFAKEGEALPELVKCDQVLPEVRKADAVVPELSDAVFLPGRGGRPRPLANRLEEEEYCLTSVGSMRLPQGLKCACILRGKYCGSKMPL